MQAELWREPARRRTVRLCAAISGDRNAAEDLAQETLLEAWRNVDKLREPAGTDRWLAAIARNVCRRWARRQGRDRALLVAIGERSAPADELDVEAELERAEFAELLDRALGLLPAETRDVLVHRYVLDSPHAEIGARLGLSTDAVSMRLSRGKASLRQMLLLEFREDRSGEDWRATRLWCSECGQHRLGAYRDAGVISFRCPGCTPDGLVAEYRLENPFFARLVGDLVRPSAMRARVNAWAGRYFAAGAEGGHAPCTRCGRIVAVRRYVRDRDGPRRDGLFVECEACGEQASSSVGGLALAQPEVRSFQREHPRTRALPVREVESAGVPALVVGYQSYVGSASVSVVLARDTLRVLAAHS